MSEKTILRLTPGAVQDGLITFRLGLWVGTREVAHWSTNSGQAGAQSLRTYDDPRSMPNNMEPIPERIYQLGKEPDWAGQSGDYSTYWSDALGPVVVDIFSPGDTDSRYRGLFRLHLDANRLWARGSAGCIVFLTLAVLKEFIAAFLQYKPTELVVDHGLGTVPGAPRADTGSPAPTNPKVFPGTLWANDNGAALVADEDVTIKKGEKVQIVTVGGAPIKLVKR